MAKSAFWHDISDVRADIRRSPRQSKSRRKSKYLVLIRRITPGSVGYIVENSSFIHFDHKSGFTLGNIIGSSNPGKNFVDITDFGAGCRYETAGLGHNHDQAVCRRRADLPAIFGPVMMIICCFIVQQYVVTDVFLTRGQLFSITG